MWTTTNTRSKSTNEHYTRAVAVEHDLSSMNLVKSTIPQEDPEFLPIPHSGETLLEDFMKPLDLSAYAVAKAIGSTPITISLICWGKRAVSVQLALRLARYFGTSARFWINLQSDYDLRTVEREIGASIEQSIVPLAAAA